MSLENREANIIWLNWKETMCKAERTQEDYPLQLLAELTKRIEACCGEDDLIEWATDEPLEERGFDPVVLYHVRNRKWTWDRMVADLLSMSVDFPEVIFQVTFIDGERTGKTHIVNGHFTAVLYDGECGELIQAF